MASSNFFGGIEDFFSTIGSDISNVAANVTKDINWLEKEATDVEQFIVNQTPVLIDGIQGLLQAASAATTAIDPAIGAIISAGAAIVKDLESIFETTGSQAPGGSATP